MKAWPGWGSCLQDGHSHRAGWASADTWILHLASSGRSCVVFLRSDVGSCMSHLTTHPVLCGGDYAGCECQMLGLGAGCPAVFGVRAVLPVVVAALTVIPTMKPTAHLCQQSSLPAHTAQAWPPVGGWPLHICCLFFQKPCQTLCSGVLMWL